MYNTSQVRKLWDPPGVVLLDALLPAYEALELCLFKWDYKIRRGVTGAYNKRKIAGSNNWSLHAYGPGKLYTFTMGIRKASEWIKVTTALAIDINSDTNPLTTDIRITDIPMGAIRDLLKVTTNGTGQQVWAWGGLWDSPIDSMHFQICCSKEDLLLGIDEDTLPWVGE